MSKKQQRKIAPAKGKLGVLTPGMGAVATTFYAGVEAIKAGWGKPVGSYTQMGKLRLGKRTEKREVPVKDFVPLANVKDIVMGGWDIFPDTAYEAASRAQVLSPEHLAQLKKPLSAIKPMPAVFDSNYVKKIDGPNKKKGKTKRHLVEALRQDIREFRENNGCERLVMVWCGSTEVYIEPSNVHRSLADFEKGLEKNDPGISPSMCYAYAALKEKVPYFNGAPHLTTDTNALLELAEENSVPVAGKDFKTGQTLMKTILAPGLRARQIGVAGWYSTNILGNRDGEVLDDPGSFKSKEVTKLSVLEQILDAETYPDLYSNICHVVRINYYPPRGDNKEGWDNIDIFGWLGYPMQIKVNFLCRDSILAAPLVLDLAIFADLAQRAGFSGIQEWLSFFFKSPMTAKGLTPVHDLFAQNLKLGNTLRHMMGEELIHHLGMVYYGEEE